MAPFVTLLAALAAIVSPLGQAVPVPQATEVPQHNCAAALILAQGISENIEDQKNEQVALAQVVDVLNQSPVDADAFAIAKANLLTFVNNGIAIRQANQVITPLGNKATEGLAVVAEAQLDELNLSLGLTGDPAKDADAINKLNDGFTNGLKQNEQNLADAMDGCQMNNGARLANGTHDNGLDKNNGAHNIEDNKDANNEDKDNEDKDNEDKDNEDKDNEDNEDKDNEDKDNEDKDNEDKDNEDKDNEDKDNEDEGKDHEGKDHEGKGDEEKQHADAKDADKENAYKEDANKEDSCDEGSGKESSGNEEADKENDKNADDAYAAQEDACN